MSCIYTSQDAYNGCLSLYSEAEAALRGRVDRMKISGGIVKTDSGYEFNISRITTNTSRKNPSCPTTNKPPGLPSLLDDRHDEELKDIADYMIPSTAYAKIVLTTDVSLFPSQRVRYNVTLQISNFDFSDLATWPPLSRMAIGSADSCSVSLGDSWSLCDELESGGEWELISMEAIGSDLQEMGITDDNSKGTVENVAKRARKGRSYADMVKTDEPNLSAKEKGYDFTPKAVVHSTWRPVFHVKQVSCLDRDGLVSNTALQEYYDLGYDEDTYYSGGTATYDSLKSFGSDARSNMVLANVAFTKKKEAGVISVGSRFKSVK